MTFTIDNENNITAHGTPAEAATATTTPFDSFSSQQEFAELAQAWPTERLVAIWNSLPGVTPAKKFKDPKTAISRIWKRIQSLGEPAQPKADAPAPVAAPQNPKAAGKAKGIARSAKGAPAHGQATKNAPAAKQSTQAKKAAKASAKVSAPRQGSKTAQVVAMLQRKNGATLTEIMAKMNWQRHTVRGFMAGALKRAGFGVESFKSEAGERTYRLPR